MDSIAETKLEKRGRPPRPTRHLGRSSRNWSVLELMLRQGALVGGKGHLIEPLNPLLGDQRILAFHIADDHSRGMQGLEQLFCFGKADFQHSGDSVGIHYLG